MSSNGGLQLRGGNPKESNPTPLVPNYLYRRLNGSEGRFPYDQRSGGQRFHGMVKMLKDAKGNKDEKKSVIDGVVGAGNSDGASGVDKTTWEAVCKRQSEILLRCYGDNVLALPVVLTSPLLCGIGVESLTEVGFSFQNPYGLPYYPGSSIKGLARMWACELGFDERRIDNLFGSRTCRDQVGSKGGLWFLDAFPEPRYKQEILTPHLQKYLQGECDEPSDYFTPIPIKFVAISPGARMWIWVVGRGDQDDSWRVQIQKILQHALDFGIGAKTSSGYGLGFVDEQLFKENALLVEGYKRESVRELEKRRKEETLASMPPEERRLEEMLEHKLSIPSRSSKYISIMKDAEKDPPDEARDSFLAFVARLAQDAFIEEDKWLTNDELASSSLPKKKRFLKEDVRLILKYISSNTVE